MSDQSIFSIGKILTGSEDRDAVHFAIAPMEAAERLYPGQHVGTDGHGRIAGSQPHIGVVDPFLRHPVLAGERCWMMLYPNSITELRHAWTHPAFPSKASGSPSESERYLRGYAERAGLGYERLLEGAKSFVRGGGDHEDGIRYHTDLESFFYDERAEFWAAFQAVTGMSVPEEMKDRQIFWCAC